MSYSNMSAARRKSTASGNVGAIQIKIRHQLNDPADAHLLKAVTTMDYPVTVLIPEDVVKQSGSTTVVMPMSPSVRSERSKSFVSTKSETSPPTGARPIDEPSTPLSRRSSILSQKEMEDEEKHLSTSLEFLFHEDEDAPRGESSTIMEKLAEWFLSKETNEVIKAIRKVLALYGQGLELSNSALVSGILTLEKFYANQEPPKTGKLVRELSKIELPRHFYKYAMAAYGWKGLNFFGKGAGIIKGSTGTLTAYI